MELVASSYEPVCSDSESARILIVDDDKSTRMLYRAQLGAIGYRVVEASSGQEALAICRSEPPDIILMDINMPGMDGFEAARAIKEEFSDNYMPVIFVTSDFDESSLAKGFEMGGDDYVPKLTTPVVLEARIRAAMRHRRLYRQLRAQNSDLELKRIHEEHEQEVAKDIFSRIAHLGCLEDAGINYIASALMVFSGDMLLAERTPYGALRVMVGDFTGHGMPAAVGTLPSAEIFYGMTAKGFHIAEVAEEINRKLYRILPRGIFCAAAIFELNSENRMLTVWNGGLPHLLLVNTETGEVGLKFDSKHLALGILPPGDFDAHVEHCTVTDADRLVAYTDGIAETENPDGELYGDARVLEQLQSHATTDTLFDGLMENLAAFRGQAEQSDDYTLIEVPCDLTNTTVASGSSGRAASKPAMPWKSQLTLEGRTLAEVDPIPTLLQSLMQIQGLDSRREELFTILTELYINALDHGVLGLESDLKHDASGFAEYFKLRQERMEALENGCIQISLEHACSEQGGRLKIRIEDSGAGFDLDSLVSSGCEAGGQLSGRGLQLVRSLCGSLKHSAGGKVAEAIYLWS